MTAATLALLHASASVAFGGSTFFSVQPAVYVAPGDWALIPASTLTASLSSPLPHQGPSMSCWSSPSGPITAVFFDADRGSVLLVFLSSTIDREAPCEPRPGRRQ